MTTPINPYNAGAFNSGTYSPFICNITAVTQAAQATLTTSINHGFVVGNQIQCFIPRQYGMRQLDGQTGYVTIVPAANQITTSINTSTYDAYVVPTPITNIVFDPAQVAGIGDSSTGNFSPGGVTPLPNVPPGAFENQPPS